MPDTSKLVLQCVYHQPERENGLDALDHEEGGGKQMLRRGVVSTPDRDVDGLTCSLFFVWHWNNHVP